MASSSGQADGSGRNQTAVLTPGALTMGLMQGGPQTTDSNANLYAPLVTQRIDTLGLGTLTARIDAQNAQLVTVGGKAYQPCAAATPQSVKVGTGRLDRVEVIASGTATVSIYDSLTASGNVILTIPISAPQGTTYDLQVPCNTGIYVGGAANTPALLCTYS